MPGGTPDLNEVLGGCFPGCTVIVQDEMFGYRHYPGQHVFLVEVCGSPDDSRAGSYVVKIGTSSDLGREYWGWRSCWPAALRQDLVFLPVRAFPEDEPDRPRALVYGDAHQLIGVPQTCTLEQAMLNAVLHGRPTVASIREVLVQLYERAGHLFYQVGREDDPTRPGYSLEVPGWSSPGRTNDALNRALEEWEKTPRLTQVRLEVDNLIQRFDRPAGDGLPTRRYLGAAAYIRQVLELLEATKADPGQALDDGSGLPGVRRLDVVPGMLRGPAHGDLHGRNVLVGEVRDRVLWLAVFDYEHTSDGNLVGWDFVKLETELKARAYDQMFLRQDYRFVHQIHDFELRLAEQTERHHHRGGWEAEGGTDTPAGRLEAILLQVRHLAALHLGHNRGRANRWLEEYYFLLACYGVVTGNFENLTTREVLGSLLSSGVAASRLAWPRQRLVDVWRALRLSPAAQPPPGGEVPTIDVDRLLKWQTAGYDAPLERARLWRLSGRRPEQEQAEKLLAGLAKQYPLALEIGQERVLALADLGKGPEAQQALDDLERQLRNPNEELLCRWGRLFKDEGDRLNGHLPREVQPPRAEEGRATNDQRADECYERALHKYDKAYAIRAGHYPGINTATLLLVRAALARAMGETTRADAGQKSAADLAGELLSNREDWPGDQPDDPAVWHPATEAEARLLRQEWEKADQLYRSLATRAAPQQRDAMRKQVRRILAAWDLLEVKDRGPCDRAEALLPDEPLPPPAGTLS
jgi:hypothetical protein